MTRGEEPAKIGSMITIDTTELIAISRFNSHLSFIRRMKDGRALPFRPDRGRPNPNTGRVSRDSRLVQYIDMTRVLSVFDAKTLGWATDHFADGLSVPNVAIKADTSQRIVEQSLRGFARILTDRMMDANLL